MRETATSDIDTPTVKQIGPAANCPVRSCRQFPYRLEPGDGPEVAEQIRDDISEILEVVEGMVMAAVRRRFRGADDPTMRDIAQDIRIHLWRYSLSRFDAHHGTKLTTFLHVCIHAAVSQQVRVIVRDNKRRRRHPVEPLETNAVYRHKHPDQQLDRKVDAIAADITNDPLHYFTPTQAKVFAGLMAMPTEGQLQDLAAALGYTRPSSLSMMLGRMRDRIAQIDIEGVDLANPAST